MSSVKTLCGLLALMIVIGIGRAQAQDIEVPLTEFDDVGQQVGVVYAVDWPGLTQPQATFYGGIFDTGAGVNTSYWVEQFLLGLGGIPVPIAVEDGATAQGLVAPIVGDLSDPITVMIGGMEASSIGYVMCTETARHWRVAPDGFQSNYASRCLALRRQPRQARAKSTTLAVNSICQGSGSGTTTSSAGDRSSHNVPCSLASQSEKSK